LLIGLVIGTKSSIIEYIYIHIKHYFAFSSFYPLFTLTVSYAVTANISHFYKCLSFLYGVAVR